MSTVLSGNVLNINGMKIEASEDETGYKKISFKDSSNPSGKMKFSGAKVASLETNVHAGTLTIDLANENHIINTISSIENVNFINMDLGTSGLIIIKNGDELIHTVDFTTLPNTVLMREFQLKGNKDHYNIIEYTTKENSIYLQLI